MTVNPRCGMHIAHAFLELNIFSFFILLYLKKKVFFCFVFFLSSGFTLLFQDLLWLICVLVDFTAA